ncbi:MAG: hypothetical protein HOQ03_10590 [Thermoleophilia bacterium]|nr:hypothetical protein [Thermoleophilia bacterium]
MAWGRHRWLLAQKTTVYSLRRRAWGGPQLVAQAPSHCECGEVVRADSDDELVQKVEAHVAEAEEP